MIKVLFIVLLVATIQSVFTQRATAAAIMKMLDTNNDGKITWAEEKAKLDSEYEAHGAKLVEEYGQFKDKLVEEYLQEKEELQGVVLETLDE